MTVRTPEENPKFSVPQRSRPVQPFPVVAVGVGLGGAEAFLSFARALPSEISFAVVVIASGAQPAAVREEILSAREIPFTPITVGLNLVAGKMYMMPVGPSLALSGGRFVDGAQNAELASGLEVDFFLRSLLREQNELGIGIILSGDRTDGAMATEEVKSAGGLMMAQSPTTAGCDSMPRAAIATGSCDFIAPPAALAAELVRLCASRFVAEAASGAPNSVLATTEESALQDILNQLRLVVGVDFANYKRTTIRRRIERRMALGKIEKFSAYADSLRTSPEEVGALYGDMLIKVTSFFRDFATFEALKDLVYPSLIAMRNDDEPIRIWVPGCSTGEEVYSIAITLFEYLHSIGRNPSIQIFATDLSEAALEKARSGLYIENIMADVSQERLRRFFVKSNNHYLVSKAVRDVCVFAKQNIVTDPPFSKMDLISCRNVLIYLEPVLQKRVMPIFHYALKPNGYLLLGGSESITGYSDLFSLADKQHKIFSKRPVAARLPFEVGSRSDLTTKLGQSTRPRVVEQDGTQEVETQREADRILLSRYVPAAVIINDNLEIQHFRGQTGRYLEPTAGAASFSLFKMAKDGLFIELRAGVQKCRETNTTVRSTGLRVKDGNETRVVSVETIPLRVPASGERSYLILFEEDGADGGSPHVRHLHSIDPATTPEERDFVRLRRELSATKEYLQSIIEQLETTNEELKASHEEVLSSNEELQSTNEELQTAKEEIQSTNEELTTVNEQLHNKNCELTSVNNDLNNIVTSVHFPVLILGRDLCIRRFTPMAEKVFGLIPADVGRPIRNIRLNVEIPNIEASVEEVLESGGTRESEVRDRDGGWHSVRVRPYMTSENRIDGVLIVLVDITYLKSTMNQLQLARDYSNAIIESMQEVLIVLDKDLKLQTGNRSFYDLFRVSPNETVGQPLSTIGGGAWLSEPLIERLRRAIAEGKSESFETTSSFPRVGLKRLAVTGRTFELENPHSRLLLVCIRELPLKADPQ